MRFPRPRTRVDGPAATAYAAAPEQTFEFGLRILLGGPEAELTGRD
ncbi:hypothetical protein [Streptomyces sp. NPDC054854]